MRAFLGVPIPAFEDLRSLLRDLRQCGADLKLVADDHLHLTLKFLSEIREEQGLSILALLEREPRDGPFAVAVQDVGAFPDWKKLNVVWAGLQDPEGGLGRLYVMVERVAGGLGFAPEERGFSPHLTLARKRSDRGKENAREVLNRYRGHRFGTARIEGFNLYRSTLTPAGPVYDVVGSVRL